MRLISLALAALLLLIQYPLWLGKGGWLRVSDLETQVAASRKKTEELKARNAKLESEVRDLKDGTGAVEERARYELGMIKQNEIFVQVLGANGKPAPAAAAAPSTPPASAPAAAAAPAR
jgi:cell division protein FtsB